MSRIPMPGTPGYRPYLIRQAFAAALRNDAMIARHYWRLALDAGYVPRPKTLRSFHNLITSVDYHDRAAQRLIAERAQAQARDTL